MPKKTTKSFKFKTHKGVEYSVSKIKIPPETEPKVFVTAPTTKLLKYG